MCHITQRTIAATKALKRSDFANKGISIVRQDSSFVAIVNMVISFRAAFQKKNVAYFPTAHTEDIFEHMVPSDFPSDSSPQTYRRCTRVAKFLLQRPNIHNVIWDNNGAKTGAKTPSISNLYNRTSISAWTEKRPLQVRAASEWVLN